MQLPEEDFNDAYNAFLRATGDLYGSFEVAEMTKALQAVELHLSRPVPEPSAAALRMALFAATRRRR